MQLIGMNGERPGSSAANPPQVRFSAAYLTGRERVLRREVKLLWQFAGLINRNSINPA